MQFISFSQGLSFTSTHVLLNVTQGFKAKVLKRVLTWFLISCDSRLVCTVISIHFSSQGVSHGDFYDSSQKASHEDSHKAYNEASL